MPTDILKYVIALFSMVIIAYFCIRIITAKLKKAGILKQLKFGKKKEEEKCTEQKP